MEVNEELLKAVKQVQEGSEEGFNKLYSITHNYVYFRCKSLLKNDDEAWDVLQEVYIVAFKSLSKLKENNKIYAWLGSIAYFLSMKAYRKKKDILLSEEDDGIFNEIQSIDKDTQPEQSIDDKETCNIIKELIEQLPELQKVAVIAFYFDQMNVKEIAMVFGCSEGTVKSRLNYARQFLKQAIDDKEKKHGIKLHSIAIPTIFLTLQMSLQDSPAYVQTAQKAYNNVCFNLGLKTNPIQLSDNIANNQAGQIQQLSEVTKVKSLVYKFAATSIKAKVVIFGSIAIVGTSSVIGYASLINKSENKGTPVIQTNDGHKENPSHNLIESDTSDLEVPESIVFSEQQYDQNSELIANESIETKADQYSETIPATPTPVSVIPTLVPVASTLNTVIPTLIPDTQKLISAIPTPALETPTPVPGMPTSVPEMPTPVLVMPTPALETPTPVPTMPTSVPVTPTPVPVMPTSVLVLPTPTLVTPIPVHTHTYTSVETTSATCTTDGLRTYTCVDGDDSYTEVIHAGHDDGIWYEQTATTTRIGLKVRACSRCGAILESISSPALTPTPTPINDVD